MTSTTDSNSPALTPAQQAELEQLKARLLASVWTDDEEKLAHEYVERCKEFRREYFQGGKNV